MTDVPPAGSVMPVLDPGEPAGEAIRAVASEAGTRKLRTMSSTSSVPTSQLAKWNPTERRSDRQCER